jgi:hypothetical protein
MNEYKAPWSNTLYVISAISTILLMGVPLIIYTSKAYHASIVTIVLLFLPLLLLITLLFTIRGYIITPNALLIKRLFWNSSVDLSGLISVEVDPAAMNGSIRIFGNGGMFSITGYFRNKKLGNYRAFAVNPKNSVVLKFFKRTIIVTPANPQDFKSNIEQYINHTLTK